MQAQTLVTGFSHGISLAAQAQTTADAQTGNVQKAEAAPPWWHTSGTDSELHILHVGEFQAAPVGQHAIALRFSEPFAANAGFQDQLAVYHALTGEPVTNTWRRASDPKLLYFPVPRPGRYLVRLRAGLRDAQGHTLNRSISGPVTVGP